MSSKVSASHDGQQQKRKASTQHSGQQSKRQKPSDTRAILAQETAKLPLTSGGELPLSAFLSTREFEIKALEDGMLRSKKVLSQRVFQQVPRELRRRTASHNVKKVPQRLRKRHAREMATDNASQKGRQGTKAGSSTRSRLRAETAKKLGLLAEKKLRHKAIQRAKAAEGSQEHVPDSSGIVVRAPIPKTTKNVVAKPPKPKAKFRKRQIEKTWLPTHLWHAKRATMTPPKDPLWRFALPLTPTEKCYRPTHRASGARGCIVWDASFTSTIGLEGTQETLEKVLRGCGIDGESCWGKLGTKWRDGKRTWSGWAYRNTRIEKTAIGPITIVWASKGVSDTPVVDASYDGPEALASREPDMKKEEATKRKLIVRCHPSIFLETWTEILRLSRQQRPAVQAEDLRFEIGTIDIMGPGAIESLLGILCPVDADAPHYKMFASLAGLASASCLAPKALLAFSVRDPRLRYPPRPYPVPPSNDVIITFEALDNVARWSIDCTSPPSDFFDRIARWRAGRLPSQKAINRRKGDAAPGAFPAVTSLDPAIPMLLLCDRTNDRLSLLVPWKCVQPIWYGLVHYPLSTGGNPRFGGQREIQQVDFEASRPSFPVDLLGTRAGWVWELEQRARRKREWDRRPRGKRIEFSSLDLGGERHGEIGDPFGCDFEYLLQQTISHQNGLNDSEHITRTTGSETPAVPESVVKHMTVGKFRGSLIDHKHFFNEQSGVVDTAVATIRITYLTRGVPEPCARIYRLPASVTAHDGSLPSVNTSNNSARQALRKQWLRLVPRAGAKPVHDATRSNRDTASSKRFTKHGTKPIPATTQRPVTYSKGMSHEDLKSILAGALLAQPTLPYPGVAGNEVDDDVHPRVPGEEDLIGFVTSGAFNLKEGRGTGIGSVLVRRVLDRYEAEKIDGVEHVCIVRNVGETVGRLAKWAAI